MKYKVVSVNPSEGREWGVGAKGNKFYRATLTQDKAQAERSAISMSALWYIAQAEKLMSKMDWEDAKLVGHIAQDIVYHVTDRGEAEDPNWTASDPTGWVC